MKFVLAQDHHQYTAWLRRNNYHDHIDARHLYSIVSLHGLNLNGTHELVELMNWHDNKTLEFIHAVDRLKGLKHS